MKTLLLSFLLLPALCWGGTSYYLDRAIYEVCRGDTCRLVDTLNTEGYAEVEDEGPYTPIAAVVATARACPAECTLDGEPALYASPVPDCSCMEVSASGVEPGYVRGGQIYYVDGRVVHVIRRGSTATDSSDPALIVMLEGGELLLFRELLGEDLVAVE